MFFRKVRVSGPVEGHGDELQVRIPLADGGRHLVRFAKGIGTVVGDELVVVIPPFIAESIKIRQGSIVVVDNHERKFRITRDEVNDLFGT